MTRFTLEPVDVDRDAALLHRWVTHPRAVHWMMQDATLDEVHAEQVAIRDDPHQQAWLGRDRGRAAFLAETYDPSRSPLADLHELRAGDLGMHVLVAAPEGAPEAGYTSEVFRAVMEACFADPAVQRVVVEPDVENGPIRAKNVAAGFVEVRPVRLPDKTAMLSVCTREDFEGAAAVDHLSPRVLQEAQRRLVAKAIAEYAHERLIAPTPIGDGAFVLQTSAAAYEFTARQHALEHWVVDPGSLVRRIRGEEAPVDAQALVAELAPTLGIPPPLLPVYLEEIAATLASSAWKLTRSTRTTAELVAAVGPEGDTAAGFQEIESAMTEGHPAFVANNGRIGFGVDDFHRYAPEAGQPVHLEWLAVRRALGHLSTGEGIDEDALRDGELGEEERARFRRRLEALGLRPEDYFFLPVHPWQWRTKLAVSFAPDVARHDLVHLGRGDDDHRAQQSIRTFFNATRPERYYVKVALAIQNMGFLRGLSPASMEATPAINDWVAGTVAADPVLRELGLSILRERAAAGYTGDAYHAHAPRSAHRKMVAALWRESPVGKVAPAEGLATMASLLHRDRAGAAFATALVKESPLGAEEWVCSYLRAYLVPLVHCLHAHDLAFMPHGENVVMVLRDHVPVRMFLKDIGEEVAVLGDCPLPPPVERIRADVPSDLKPLAIHTDVVDGFLRHLAAILDEDGVLAGERFWAIARSLIEEHVHAHPDLADAAARYDLLTPRFRHSCLNRLQLRNTLEMVDITDQAESLLFAGTLANPLS